MRSSSFFLLLLFLSACSQSSVTLRYQKPPVISMALKNRVVAIVGSERQNSEEKEIANLLVSDLEKRFVESGQFQVVDLSTSEKREALIKEALETSLTSNDAALLKLGYELNAAVLLVLKIQSKTSYRQEKKQRTIRLGSSILRDIFYKKYGDPNTVRIEKSKEVIVEDVYEVREFSLSGQVKLVNVETGEVISSIKGRGITKNSRILVKDGAKDLSAHFFDALGKLLSFGKGSQTEHPQFSNLAQIFIEDLSLRSVNQIAPVLIQVPTVIFKTGQLEVGARLAKVNKWKEAIARWERVLAEESDNARCLHNLGAGYVMVGDLKKSDLYLTEAVSLDDEEQTIELLKNIENFREKVRQTEGEANEAREFEKTGKTLESLFEEDDFFDEDE